MNQGKVLGYGAEVEAEYDKEMNYSLGRHTRRSHRTVQTRQRLCSDSSGPFKSTEGSIVGYWLAAADVKGSVSRYWQHLVAYWQIVVTGCLHQYVHQSNRGFASEHSIIRRQRSPLSHSCKILAEIWLIDRRQTLSTIIKPRGLCRAPKTEPFTSSDAPRSYLMELRPRLLITMGSDRRG